MTPDPDQPYVGATPSPTRAPPSWPGFSPSLQPPCPHLPQPLGQRFLAQPGPRCRIWVEPCWPTVQYDGMLGKPRRVLKMRWSRWCRHVAALSLLASFAPHELYAATPISLQKDGAVSVAGRSLRCPNTWAVLNWRLPNLGLAARGVVVLSPRLLNQQSDTVRLFVFHHECGHHHVGGSETGADCWAVKQGVRQGWLDRQASHRCAGPSATRRKPPRILQAPAVAPVSISASPTSPLRRSGGRRR